MNVPQHIRDELARLRHDRRDYGKRATAKRRQVKLARGACDWAAWMDANDRLGEYNRVCDQLANEIDKIKEAWGLR